MSTRLVSLKDLLNRPDEELAYLVQGMFIRGGLGLLAGKPKAGKSTLARVLGFAVSRGEPFLGLPSKRGPVLYYAMEEKESEVRRHFCDMGASGSEEVYISTTGFAENALDALERDILRLKPALVIIDPLFRLVRVRDSSAYAEVSNALSPLMRIARSTEAHILCVHHLGKGQATGADAILGSTAIRGAFDINLLLNRSDKTRTLKSEQRYGEDLEETVLEYDEDNRTIQLGELKEDSDTLRIESQITAFLKRSYEPKSEKEIEHTVIGKTKWKRAALRELVEKGLINRHGSGRKGDKYHYELVPSFPAPAKERGNNQTPDFEAWNGVL